MLVINPASGSGTGARVVDEVKRRAAPRRDPRGRRGRRHRRGVARAAAGRAEVLAVGGGDGTVSCAGGHRRRRQGAAGGVPRRDVQPLRQGHRLRQGGRIRPPRSAEGQGLLRGPRSGFNEADTVINTASIGAYRPFVRVAGEARAQDRQTAGRGCTRCGIPCGRDERVRITYDNKTVQTSLFFRQLGVSAPSGFAPSRAQKDGRRADRRSDPGNRAAGSPGSATSSALVLGRLVRSPLYHEMRVPEFSFAAVDGPIPHRS